MAGTVDREQVETVLDAMSEPAPDRIAVPAAAAAAATRAEPPLRNHGPKPYDFSHPDLLSREQARSLRTMHEGFAQSLAKRLSTDLLANVVATVAGVDHLTYAEFQMLLPTPTVLGVVDVPALQGKIAIDLNPGVAFAFVDRILGGPGAPLGKPRALTAIEVGLTDRILTRTCEELGRMWTPIQEISFSLATIEANPELARVVNPEEMVILISVELEMNETKGRMNICLPYVVMEPAIHRMALNSATPDRAPEEAAHARSGVETSLRSAPVPVDVDLGTALVTLRELLALQAGDVIRIVPASASGARALIAGVPRLNGTPGTHHGRRAFRTDSPCGPPPDSRSRT